MTTRTRHRITTSRHHDITTSRHHDITTSRHPAARRRYAGAMADLTDDPTDPRLTHGVDATSTPQAEAYLVLSEAERAQGFVRPVRRTYVHVGIDGSEFVDDTDGRQRSGLVPPGCGRATTMSLALAETYARDPSFYGATYCVGCQRHLSVAEFVWADDTDQVVGS